eukprot:TRINITY_DN63330_c0_g1_i1.p1 TRINITY_DN63330_c0_g1~~TRINITY_DN63330_c0_g1_i1.p1  ORF type:complete len:691 (+),score=174.32 TRINITY_DN63330_c0_g1_i1:27-2075(+)
MAPTGGDVWGSAQEVLEKAISLAGKAKGQELLDLAQAQLTAAQAAGDRHGEAVALLTFVHGYLGADRYSDAEQAASTALALFRELGLGACRQGPYKGTVAAATLTAAQAAQREAALRLARNKLLLFREIGVPSGEVAALLNVADEQLNTGKPEQALLLAKEAQKAAKRAESPELEVSVMQFVAEAFLKASLPGEAVKAAEKAGSLAKGEGNSKAQAHASLKLAKAHAVNKAPKAALENASAAIALFKEVGDTGGEAEAQIVAAESHCLLESCSEALELANEAAQALKSLKDSAGEARALLAAAGAEEGLGERQSGLKSARLALALARKARDTALEGRARDVCARLREKVPDLLPEKEAGQAVLGVTRPIVSCSPGISGPGTLPKEPFVGVQRLCGSQERKSLAGMVCCVTGASRGIGKGISQCLAEAGAIVYVTGRSSPGKETDVLLMGTVDETAAGFTKLGGTGVAVHVDHAQDSQNASLAKLIAENHGRLDVCVNSAFYIPKPDLIFFNTPIWNQPIRFLNEQTAVGGINHAAQVLSFLPYLRRGKGVVINVSSWGSQMNIPVFPLSYYVNKATFDRTQAALSERLRDYGVNVMTLWPGSVKSERSVMGAKRGAVRLIDLETTRFTGNAIVELASLRPEVLRVYSQKHRTLSSADVLGWDMDGYLHQGDLHTFTTGGSRQ